MAEVRWELIIFVIIAGLVIFAALGIFIGMRISSDKRRIRELEDELMQARKDLEAYRSRVNNHFKKTSELFSQLTNSYKAVYMHLAEGSQELCTTDAALLKPANAEFLRVTHEERAQTGQEPESPGAGAVREQEEKKDGKEAGRSPGEGVRKVEIPSPIERREERKSPEGGSGNEVRGSGAEEKPPAEEARKPESEEGPSVEPETAEKAEKKPVEQGGEKVLRQEAPGTEMAAPGKEEQPAAGEAEKQEKEETRPPKEVGEIEKKVKEMQPAEEGEKQDQPSGGERKES
jgi:hypothetical protein